MEPVFGPVVESVVEPVVESVVEPLVELIKLPVPTSTFYQYVPTEPTILSPYVEVVDTKQKEIDELREIVRQLLERSGSTK